MLLGSRLRLALSILLVSPTPALAYDKAVEGSEVVLNKLFPKKSKVELDGRFGVVLNSSYQQTFLANAGISYFFSEEWGFQLEGSAAIVSDKNERACIETFYNDPNYNVADECDGTDKGKAGWAQDESGDANYGPAYVPIRTLKYMFVGNLLWNPIYGKQIVLLSATNYFDFYIATGGGIAMSEFYPKSPILADGKTRSRGEFCTENCPTNNVNPGTTDPNLVGEAGRPNPEQQTHPLIHLAVGQRFHFLKRFVLNASLENYTLVGTDAGFDNFLTIMGGVGVRF